MIEEEVDHIRGPAAGHLILEYGDYECPYSRQAYREIERIERGLSGGIRFGFRHFPLTEIHPHALAAAGAAEAAALQARFWDMHDLLFHRQQALEDDDLRRYASELGLDVPRFSQDRSSPRSSSGLDGTSRAVWRRERCAAPRLCSSTASCTSAATTQRR